MHNEQVADVIFDMHSAFLIVFSSLATMSRSLSMLVVNQSRNEHVRAKSHHEPFEYMYVLRD